MSIFTLLSRALFIGLRLNFLFLAKEIFGFYVADFVDAREWNLVGWMDWELDG